jgi:DNA-binding XRE family transcriptional regulator
MVQALLPHAGRSYLIKAPILYLNISVLHPVDRYRLSPDGYRSHTYIVSLPIGNIQLRGKVPENKAIPKELVSYGDHIRKRRIKLGLSQSEVARIINVQTDTITNWELNRFSPLLIHVPKIIQFLGYTPNIANENPIIKYRIENGITQKEMARILKVDPGTLARFEKGRNISKQLKERIEKLVKYQKLL